MKITLDIEFVDIYDAYGATEWLGAALTAAVEHGRCAGEGFTVNGVTIEQDGR